MTNLQPQKKNGVPLVPILLLLLALGTGGGCIYWLLSDSAPAWLSVLLPSSPYQKTGTSAYPSEADTEETASPSGDELAHLPVAAESSAPQENDAQSGSLPSPDPSEAGNDASVVGVEIDFSNSDDISGSSSLPASAPPAEREPLSGPTAVADLPADSEESGQDSSAARSGEPDADAFAPPPPPPSVQKDTGPVDNDPGKKPPVPLIRYGKGKPVSEKGSIVSGDIPKDQQMLEASAVSSKGGPDPGRALLSGRDSVVDISLLDSLAAFLAADYWPEGTHPLARGRGITTASLRWANMQFGGRLQGFVVNHDTILEERARVLRYIFMPSMIQGLYALYHEHFFAVLEKEALAQRRGPEQSPFTNGQVADMFALYAGMARGLSGCVRAYASTPDIRGRINAYIAASDAATAAYLHYSEIQPTPAVDRDRAARRYQEAVIKREQQRENVAAALRRSGPTSGLDSDSLVYAAMWLYRRGEVRADTLNALRAMFSACAGQFTAMEKRYRAKPAGKSAAGAGF
jgi:hypothetical protein